MKKKSQVTPPKITNLNAPIQQNSVPVTTSIPYIEPVIIAQTFISKPPIYTPALVQMPVVIQDNKQLLAEIELLKNTLVQKNIVIEKLSSEKEWLFDEKQQLFKNNSILTSQLGELSQEKKELKTDKIKLTKEIQELQLNHSMHLSHKDLEIEQLKKEFAELTNMSVIQDLSEVVDNHDNILKIEETVQSVQIDSVIHPHNIEIPLNNTTTEIFLAGNNSETHIEFSTEFSIVK